MMQLLKMQIMDKQWQMLCFYPIFVKEWIFEVNPILTGTCGGNTPCVKILSIFIEISNFYAKNTIFAIFSMSQKAADIYERVRLRFLNYFLFWEFWNFLVKSWERGQILPKNFPKKAQKSQKMQKLKNLRQYTTEEKTVVENIPCFWMKHAEISTFFFSYFVPNHSGGVVNLGAHIWKLLK